MRDSNGLGGVTSLVSDRDGSVLAAVPNTEWTSTSVARVYSDPFGGIRGNTDADVPGDHRFLGATRDADSGLTLLGARYYDPVTGCFISVDPILNFEVPAHLHAYAYGFNNPVTFSDASGLEPRDQNGNFDGDPYSSPSTTSWAYLNGCGGNLSCVGTWLGQNTLHYYGGLAEGVSGLLFLTCSLCMGGMGAYSTLTALSDWDAHLENEQAKGEQFREWWSDPWNNFWRPIGEDWANNPGHATGGTVITAGTLLVPGGGLIKLGSASRTATASALATSGGSSAGASSVAAAGRSALLSADWAEASGAWRALATTKGPFGLGSATKSEAVQLGMDWVGPNPSLSSSGALVSANGLRQWRPPTYKSARGTHQSNFEWRSEPSGWWVGNGHLEVPEMNQ